MYNMIVFVCIVMMIFTGCYGERHDLESTPCYQVPDYKEVIYDVPLEPDHVINKRSLNSQLRIHTHFDSSIDSLPFEHQNLIKDKVLLAVKFWEDTLMLRRTNVPIRLNRQCQSRDLRYWNGIRYCRDGCSRVTMCGDIEVPSEHLRNCEWWDSVGNEYHTPRDTQPGIINSDFVLYVAALYSTKCQWQKTVAFAAHCQLEKALDRPVAGYISICPHSVSTSIHKHEELLYTIKHEILHALGFTAGLYAFYRDQFGRPLTPRDAGTKKPPYNRNINMYQWSDRVVKAFTRYDWRLKGQTIHKTVNMIITPNVVREVRKHFHCLNLEGAELEDQGINGTAYTHWEKRVFENEFMTGTFTQNPVISRISLALMEDTGWYSVKYENAGNLEWGQNLGCDFVKKSCYEWIETRLNRNEDIHPFCIHANRGQPKTDCTRNRKAVAICNLSEFTRNLEPQYQYFSSIPGVRPVDVGKYGGSVSLADYCPYLQEFVWKQEEHIVRGSRCALMQNTLEPTQNFLQEKYSPRSKCFNHGQAWTLYKCNYQFTPHSGSGCYEYKCRSDTGLTIFVMGKAYQCYYTGQQLAIYNTDDNWLYHGNITCPSCQEVCQIQGVSCPPEDRRVYTVRKPKHHIPCTSSIANSAKFSTVLYFCVIFMQFV